MNRRQVVACFRETVRASAGAAGAVGQRGDADSNPGLGLRIGADSACSLTPAAVLIPIVDRDSGLTVILTRRTDDLPDHAGQISFPGGRIDLCDEGPVDAALRETEEEIGLERAQISVLGQLDTCLTGTGFSVTPVVGFVQPPFALKPNSREVAEAFEVPLTFLMNPDNHQYHERVIKGRDRNFYAIPYGKHFIWGATAGMLMNLYECLAGR